MSSALIGTRRLVFLLALMLGMFLVYASGALAVGKSTQQEPITAQGGCSPAPCWPIYSRGDVDK